MKAPKLFKQQGLTYVPAEQAIVMLAKYCWWPRHGQQDELYIESNITSSTPGADSVIYMSRQIFYQGIYSSAQLDY